MKHLDNLKVKIFADGANLADIRTMYAKPWIKGFTTNPTLMRKAGIVDYRAFAADVLKVVPDRPVSFEVFADDFEEMAAQAFEIASWGENVYVKIPITNTKRESSAPLIRRLSKARVKLNVTAIMTLDQIRSTIDAVARGVPAVISVFAGRIADTGVDPVPVMREAAALVADKPWLELLWASPRELLNVVQAAEVGCHIITATTDILNKLSLLGKDHVEYSLDTVKMFYRDAVASGFAIPCSLGGRLVHGRAGEEHPWLADSRVS